MVNPHNDPPATANIAEAALAWQAFCYVMGEMAASEEQAFERRLLEDQAAREAVAHSVEIAEAVRVVVPEQTIPTAPAPAKFDWRRALVGLGLGVAAGLGMVLLARPDAVPALAMKSNSESHAPNLHVETDNADRELVLAWSEVRGIVAAPWQDEPIENVGVVEEIASPLEDSPNADEVLPTWLLAASTVGTRLEQ